MSNWEMGMLAEWNGHAAAYATDIYYSNIEKVVATAYDDNLTGRPNARLIAAAPDLLSACEMAFAMLKSFANSPAVLEPIAAAIAKAKGEHHDPLAH